jgi:hypothetical protein
MEYCQTIQNRTAQTAAVINQWLPTLSLGGVTAELLGRSAADNAGNRGLLALQALTIALPKVAEGEIDDAVAAESALLDLLSPVYAIAPRTTESALEHGRKLQ